MVSMRESVEKQRARSLVARHLPLLAVIFLAIAMSAGLAACGQKGPLRLPPPAAAASAPSR